MSNKDNSCHGDDNTTLLQWASRINSRLNEHQLELLDSIQVMNSFIDAVGTGETLIPVGSCMDGSKVNIPRDAGDIDVLIVSGKVVLSERLFEYIPGFPAFLLVPVKDEHAELFKEVTPVDGGYLPAYVLQDMEKSLFNFVRMMVTSNLLPESGDDRMRLVRQSKVGFEQQEVTGVRSDIGGVLKMPKEKLEYGEGLFNGLTYLNEGASIILSGLQKSKKSDKKTKEVQKEVISDGNVKVETYKGVEDIFHVASDIISKFKGFVDSDSDGSNTDCGDDMISDKEMSERKVNVVEEEWNDPGQELSKANINTNTNDKDTAEVNDGHNANKEDGKVFESPQETLGLDFELDNAEPFEEMDTTNGSWRAESRNSGYTVQKNSSHESHATVDRPPEEALMEASMTSIEEFDTPVDYENLESADFVPAFMFTGWPQPASEWIHRTRKWPTEEVKQEILQTTCQVIVKPLPTNANSDRTYTPMTEDKVFRLSFASQELILARSLNETQVTCWKILKAFQKSCFETQPRVMTSYLWKNAIFWISEKTDPSFWKQENTLEGINMALDFALECMKTRFFPQYFTREMNLILQCDTPSIQKTIEAIEMLKKNPVIYVREFIETPPKPSCIRVSQLDVEKLMKSKENQSVENAEGLG